MIVTNISEKKFKTLKPFDLPNNVFNTEGQMYIYTEKDKWETKEYVMKKLFHDNGTAFSNKLFTVNELIDKKDTIGIEELVLPEKLISVHGKIVGFISEKRDNLNFQTVLDSYEFTNKKKIEYFKEIGRILETMKNIRTYTSLTDFYLNDLHENNFILNTKTGKINVVDMDSCKINGNIPFPARYLSPISLINSVSKYKRVEENSIIDECFEIDENTEYYCYMVMILNYLYGNRITSLSIDGYYDYLAYLHSVGVSYELIDKLALIYTEHDNINVYEYIDELSKLDGRTNYRVYKRIRK